MREPHDPSDPGSAREVSITSGVPTLAETAAEFELIHGLSPAVCSALVIQVKNGGK
jgi:hypothetical protein